LRNRLRRRERYDTERKGTEKEAKEAAAKHTLSVLAFPGYNYR
jgi:hypothetical protein